MGIRNWQTWRTVLEAKVHNGLLCLRRSRRRRRRRRSRRKRKRRRNKTYFNGVIKSLK
jgi:hypothetical protein